MENKAKGTMNKALMVGTGLITLSAAVAPQAQAASATGNITAEILAPIVLAVPTNLNFGTMTVGALGGTAVMDTADGRTQTGDVTLVTAPPLPAPQPPSARVTVAGAVGPTIRLEMDAVSYTVSNGAVTMVVDQFLIGGGLVPGATQAGTTLAADDVVLFATTTLNVFGIGGTLNVAGAQAPGSYTGTFTINAAYQ